MGNSALKSKSKKFGVSFGLTSNLSKKELSSHSSGLKLGRNSKSMTKMISSNSMGSKKLPPPSPTNSSFENLNINKLKVQTNIKNEKEDYQIILNSLTNHHLFHYVENENIKKLMNKLIKCEAEKNITIYEKDVNEGEYFFILTKGKMHYNASISEKIKEFQDLSINPGNCFGDYELVNDISRLCDVITDEKSTFYALKKNDLMEVLKNVRKKNINNITKFIEENYPFLNSFPEAKKFLIHDSITIYNFKKASSLVSCAFDEMINNNVFFIVNGEVDTIYKYEAAKCLRKGDIIGHRELILNDNYLRNIYLSTKSNDVELYSISYNSIIAFLKEGYFVNDVTFFIFCLCWKKSEFLFDIDINTLYKIFPNFKIESYGPNDIIFKKGECLSEQNIIILEGNIFLRNQENYEAVRNEILYEKELVYNANTVLLVNDLIAYPEALLLTCPREKIRSTLGGKCLSEIVSSNSKKKALQSIVVDLLKKVNCFNYSKIKVKELEEYLSLEKYESKVPIINQGSKDLSKIYMIKSGYVDIYINHKYIRTLSMGSPFGFKSILSGSKARTASVIANSPVEVYSIDFKAFDKYVLKENPTIISFLKNKINLEDDSIELEDLENIRLLGKGSFGFVCLVRSKKTKALYAIKSIPLKKIMELDMYEGITNEKNALRMLDHNFILKQVKTLKNSQNIFFLNEYIKGKTLNKIIKEIGMLNKSQAQFYAGSILLAIEYMHSNNLIHRDIKPENIMVGETGYIKLIDFGTVKETISSDGTTHTTIGTPHYMAPEVIRGDSYNRNVDYWSIGVCIYEFICGKTPFAPDVKDPVEIYKAVQNDKVTFPNFVKDKDFINLINSMLEKDVSKRKFGIEIKDMNWFSDFDFNSLYEMNTQVPTKPIMSDSEDKVSKSDYLSELKNLYNKYSKVKEKEKEKAILTDVQKQKGEEWLKNF